MVVEEERTYKFGELSPRAQKHAIEYFQKLQYEDLDTRFLTEQFEEKLDELGLPSDKISWSLSWSQGDGVVFPGRFDVKEYLEKNNLRDAYASLFVPSYFDEEESGEISPEMRSRMEKHAAIVSEAIRKLGFKTSTQETRDCVLVDVREKEEWIATFCVAPKGKRKTSVFVQSEIEDGTGAYIFSEAEFPEDVASGEPRKNEYEIPIDDLSAEITASSRYASMGIDLEPRSRASLTRTQVRDLDRLEEHLKNHVHGIAKQLEKIGYEHIEWETGEENIKEMLEGSDHEFDEDGNLA